jgi:transcriptional regulator with XRE-family HTH domain
MTVYSFTQILEKCARLGVSQKQLCSVADVNEGTLSRAKKAEREPTNRIRRRLSVAIDEIAAERGVTFVHEEKATMQ